MVKVVNVKLEAHAVNRHRRIWACIGVKLLLVGLCSAFAAVIFADLCFSFASIGFKCGHVCLWAMFIDG